MTTCSGRQRALNLLTALALVFLCWCIARHLAAPARRPTDGAAAPAGWPELRIDVNTASAVELTLLPGIGPALAARIADYRDAHGPFASLDDLDDVRGIGPKTIAGLEPFAAVGAAEPAED